MVDIHRTWNRFLPQGRLTIKATAFLLALAGLFYPLIAVQPATARSFKVLHSFKGKKDGAHADAGLVQNSQGNLYGTTSGDNESHFGTVYKLDSANVETVLHNFTDHKDGGIPFCDLVLDDGGNIYGTTSAGGRHNQGTVFKISGGGLETVLYNFTGGSDGGVPDAGVIRDSVDNFYGTTSAGGASGGGVVFKLDSTGKETVLYRFTGGADGSLPAAPLIQDASGNLYGTTAEGGNSGAGVIFKLDTAGKETVLYSFTGGKDGAFPLAGLVRDSAGNLYGTALEGGRTNNGTVFKLAAGGKFAVLYGFKAAPDGAFPHGGLVRDQAGNFYGTTLEGGKSGLGTVFMLSKTGKETILHNFAGTNDGEDPLSTLFRDSAGNLYGATDSGGKYGWGTVFKLTP